jgi:hypothetical protein
MARDGSLTTAMNTSDTTIATNGEIVDLYAQVLAAKHRLRSEEAPQRAESEKVEMVRQYLAAVGSWVAIVGPACESPLEYCDEQLVAA